MCVCVCVCVCVYNSTILRYLKISLLAEVSVG